jgi:hypothetical protein
MIDNWLSWAKGRSLWLPAVAWIAAILFVYTLWCYKVFGFWAPYYDDYGISALEIAPIVAGLIAIYGILPRMDWIDAQAISHPQRHDSIAAVTLVCSFALIPPLARWLFSLSDFYVNFIPVKYRYPGQDWLQAIPYNVIWVYAAFIVGVLGLGILMAGLAGRTVGPILGLLSYAAILYISGISACPRAHPKSIGLGHSGHRASQPFSLPDHESCLWPGCLPIIRLRRHPHRRWVQGNFLSQIVM